jgi:cellulose synthase/poly-beta-1,6-N-acetylglucosamine synthase-like glycosyltransferase
MPATLERPTYPGGDIRHEDEAPDRPLTPIVASGPAHVLGHVRIACIVAAHNEEHGIAGTLESLWWQTRAPDLIIVAADNCDDETAGVARACGADVVFHTVGNRDRKAGALNQALSLIGRCDYVVQVDADVELSAHFVQRAVELMERDDRIGAVGAMATVRAEGGFLNLMQRMWFVRYSFIESGRGLHPHCLDGKGVVFRRAALDAIGPAPWDGRSIVEDFTIGRELVRRGWRTRRVASEWAAGEGKRSTRDLFIQHVRWTGGTMKELRRFGVHIWTVRPIAEHLFEALETLLFFGWIAAMVAGAPMAWWLVALWLPASVIENVVMVWPLGWAARLTALAFIPNLVTSLVAWKGPFWVGVWRTLWNRDIVWERR